ncbi:MAG TPA: cytidylate kinase-like family protein, partial [Anaerolineaceae bacterium]|nr:cytidylate kinase-like family protein [Anaerolineaceae bacterium]
GNVIIVGRASQLILKNFPNSLHLRIIAGIETRIKNVHETKNVSEKAAKAQIEESDRQRMSFIKKMYDKDWNDPTLYDLTINMDSFKLNQIANWILSL